jgi:hypothetical protein
MLMIILSITPWKKTLIGQMVGVHDNLASDGDSYTYY